MLPAILAVPFYEGQAVRGYFEAYFEMISALTTTGATLYDAPGLIDDSLHLWRGLVGWLGGFMSWVVAFAILAPLNLGGFEVVARGQGAGAARTGAPGGAACRDPRRCLPGAPARRPFRTGLRRGHAGALGRPGGARRDPLRGRPSTRCPFCSTSGISPVGGLDAGLAGRAWRGVAPSFSTCSPSRG